MHANRLSSDLGATCFSATFFCPPNGRVCLRDSATGLSLRGGVLTSAIRGGRGSSRGDRSGSGSLPLSFSCGICPAPIRARLAFRFCLSSCTTVSCELCGVTNRRLARCAMGGCPKKMCRRCVSVSGCPGKRCVLRVYIGRGMFDRGVVGKWCCRGSDNFVGARSYINEGFVLCFSLLIDAG